MVETMWAGEGAAGAMVGDTVPGAGARSGRVDPDDDWTVIAALLPAAAAGFFHFGLPALAVMTGAAAGCLALRALALPLSGRDRVPTAGRAALVGLLLGMSLPPASPAWLVIAGCAVAMLCGVGQRQVPGLAPLHPTVAAMGFLLIAFPAAATGWTQPVGLFGLATPSAATASIGAVGKDVVAGLVGRAPGGSGATSVLALALGGAYLTLRGIVRWRTPALFLASLAAPAAVFATLGPRAVAWAGPQLLGGGVVLAAVFIATDRSVAPRAPRGKLIHAAGCGVLTWQIGTVGDRQGAVWFAMLLMAMLIPLIDLYTAPASSSEARPGETC